jgi:hypothetical protein
MAFFAQGFFIFTAVIFRELRAEVRELVNDKHQIRHPSGVILNLLYSGPLQKVQAAIQLLHQAGKYFVSALDSEPAPGVPPQICELYFCQVNYEQFAVLILQQTGDQLVQEYGLSAVSLAGYKQVRELCQVCNFKAGPGIAYGNRKFVILRELRQGKVNLLRYFSKKKVYVQQTIFNPEGPFAI